MTLADLLSTTRYLVDDRAQPYQVTDAELTRYLNEAEGLFAKRTYCLLDSEFATVTTVAGQSTYDLDPLVIEVLRVEDADALPLLGTWTSRVGSLITGKPRYFTTRPRSVLFWPVPDGAYVLQMLVARRPLNPLEVGTDEPEIPEEYHLALCDWAAYKWLRVADPDNQNLKAAMQRQADWELQLRDAKRDLYRFTTLDSVPAILRRGGL